VLEVLQEICGVHTVASMSDAVVVGHKQDSLFVLVEVLNKSAHNFGCVVRRGVGDSSIAPGSHKLLYA